MNAANEKPSMLRAVRDGWQSLISGIGTLARSRDKTRQFVRDRSMSAEDLATLYDGDALSNIICTMPPADMFKRGYAVDIEDDATGEVGDAIVDRAETLDVNGAFVYALSMQRAMGRAGILLMIDDGRTLDEPVNYSAIQAVRWLRVFDARALKANQRDTDPLSPTFGQPLSYTITVTAEDGTSPTFEVHPERLIIFEDGGPFATPQKRSQSDGVVSTLTRAYDAIKDYGYSWASVAELLDQYSIGVWKIGHLRQLLAKESESILSQRFAAMDMGKSHARSLILDRDNEDYEWRTVTFAGIPDLMDRMMNRISSTVGIPVVKLFGMSPAGMNATGESDLRNYYDTVAAFRDTSVTPLLESVLSLLFVETEGANMVAEPDVWRVDWNSLWQPTEAEIATTELQAGQLIRLLSDGGIIEAEEARSAIGPNAAIKSITLDEELFMAAQNEPEPEPVPDPFAATEGDNPDDEGANGSDGDPGPDGEPEEGSED